MAEEALQPREIDSVTCPHAQTGSHAKFFKGYLREHPLITLQVRTIKTGAELVIKDIAFPGHPAGGWGDCELDHVPGGHKITVFAAPNAGRGSSNPVVRAVAQILCAELRLKGRYRVGFDFDEKWVKVVKIV